MKIGIIGSGFIGSRLAGYFVKAGHEVRLANSRGVDAVRDVATKAGAIPADAADAVKDADVIVISIPFPKVKDLVPILAGVPENTVVIDTGNYYPMRDGKMDELEAGKVETVWVAEQLNRPNIVKAWNALGYLTLEQAGQPKGTPGRLAIPIAGNDARAKKVTEELVDITGSDALDVGGLEESWRFQPGNPSYCTELTLEELKLAVAHPTPESAPKNRDESLVQFMSGKVPFTREAATALVRQLNGWPLKQ